MAFPYKRNLREKNLQQGKAIDNDIDVENEDSDINNHDDATNNSYANLSPLDADDVLVFESDHNLKIYPTIFFVLHP